MQSVTSASSIVRIADVLAGVRSKGVRLWSERGQLHYEAPKGVLTAADLQSLRQLREQIVALLEGAAGTAVDEPTFAHRPSRDIAPLTYTQLARLHYSRLHERPSKRAIAGALRLRGTLNLHALQRSVTEVACRHEALRTRIVRRDDGWVQQIGPPEDLRFEVRDLATRLGEISPEELIKRHIEELILEPIDIAVGPSAAMRLLRMQPHEHVLVVALDHMISDMTSLNILLRDLFAAYAQTVQGDKIRLPEIPLQFSDYAFWQRNTQSRWLGTHQQYWDEHLAGCRRLGFPEDRAATEQDRPGWGDVPIKIDKILKASLREWCRQKQTTLVMCVFAAYIALVLRWCDASEAVIQYRTHGRVSPKVENTIGFFASELYLRVALFDDDTFVDLMQRVQAEYCRAYEHADCGYLAADAHRPGFTLNTVFNWSPRESKLDLSEAAGSADALVCSPIPFEHPVLRALVADSEPTTVFYDTGEEAAGDVYFPLCRFSPNLMQRFARNFLVLIRAFMEKPDMRVKEIALCD